MLPQSLLQKAPPLTCYCSTLGVQAPDVTAVDMEHLLKLAFLDRLGLVQFFGPVITRMVQRRVQSQKNLLISKDILYYPCLLECFA